MRVLSIQRTMNDLLTIKIELEVGAYEFVEYARTDRMFGTEEAKIKSQLVEDAFQRGRKALEVLGELLEEIESFLSAEVQCDGPREALLAQVRELLRLSAGEGGGGR